MSKVEVGAAWSRHSFGKVLAVTPTAVTVENEAGKSWQVDPKLFADEFKTSSESDFTKTESLSRTATIQKFENLVGQAVTVNFNKKVDKADLLKKVCACKSNLAAVIKTLEDGLDGEERTMTGYHRGARDDFGRLHFTELGQGGRLVDPRTINWFIADGVKYVVK